jgi:Bifunctional DNA primase/polymerase, N-terminal/AAA domain
MEAGHYPRPSAPPGLSLAEEAIALGLPCFPCRLDRKPVTEHGFKEASSDPDTIRSMFDMPGATAIGVPTGQASGFVVIDPDVKHGARGMEWYDAHRHLLPKTRTHRTQTGGLHLLFQPPPDIEIRNSQSRIASGVDVRGEGGYVIFPPTPGYTVEDDAEPAEMPEWLAKACQRPEPRPVEPAPRRERSDTAPDHGSPYGARALDGECDAIRRAQIGQQEHTINAAGLKIGGLVVGGELEEGPALAALFAAARTVPSAPGERPWSQQELEAKVRRAFKDGQRQPRQAPPRAEPLRERPKVLQADGPGHAPPCIISAPALMAKALPPLRFAVNELLPVGYTVLAGPPKLGKSWLAYQLASAVASGADLFGQGTSQGEVLYLALEDGERRMQSRLQRLLGDRAPPPALSLAPKWPRLDKGGMEGIEDWAKGHGDSARLCIIDTMQKIKPPAPKAGGNAYEQDYELHGQLHGLAHRLGIALVNITHMRKGSSGGDFVEAVIGSGGITGSADTIMALKRDRGKADAFLHVTGRDVQEEELALRSDNGLWSCLGAAEHVRMGETKKKLLAALAGAGERGLSPREAAEVADVNHNLAKQTLRRMADAGEIVNLGGRYARRPL